MIVALRAPGINDDETIARTDAVPPSRRCFIATATTDGHTPAIPNNLGIDRDADFLRPFRAAPSG